MYRQYFSYFSLKKSRSFFPKHDTHVARLKNALQCCLTYEKLRSSELQALRGYYAVRTSLPDH